MNNYEQELEKELAYFQTTITMIRAQLEKKLAVSERSRGDLISVRKEMWDHTAHSSNDFERIAEMVQFAEELERSTASYLAGTDDIQKLKKMQDSPYFARVDFSESEDDESEKIYIGRYSLMDDDRHDMIVFDWRSPIASIFYRYELGRVQYETPGGVLDGIVSLKRQYEIKQGAFEYFFDANVQIVDAFLRKLLSKNASAKMTSIVETIQKDQDIIIRDADNELLMVQGVAGSGKTSVALHRVAYLMYQGLSSKLSSNHIVILSPNALFAKYISNVLPELGEDHVRTLGFEEICSQILGEELQGIQSRNQLFEELVTCTLPNRKVWIKSSMEFKASDAFVVMLSRLVTYCERHWIPFRDVMYNRRQLFDRQSLKQKLLGRESTTPVAVKLKQIETMILREVREEQKSRISRLEQFVEKFPDHIYEVQAFARMLSIKENRRLLTHIRKFTELDYAALYRQMFHNQTLFYALARGLELPENIEEIRRQTDASLSHPGLRYEDALALTFLKIKLAGCDSYKSIKQVVIDEAQDYYPIHFEILHMLFPKARYTVLGDINQTIEKNTSITFYGRVQHILHKKSSALLTLSKSFRCTNQIIAFSAKFMDQTVKQECFSRDGLSPEVIHAATQQEADEQVKAFIRDMKAQDYNSVCILCKSLKESAQLYDRIKDSIDVALMDDTYGAELSDTLITPIYMAKGLEFDAVLIYQADDSNYQSSDDKKLLYIASTRALHRLVLLYAENPSRFLAEQEDTHND